MSNRSRVPPPVAGETLSIRTGALTQHVTETIARVRNAGYTGELNPNLIAGCLAEGIALALAAPAYAQAMLLEAGFTPVHLAGELACAHAWIAAHPLALHDDADVPGTEEQH